MADPPYAALLLKNNVKPLTQLSAPFELHVETPPAEELKAAPQVTLQLVKVVPVDAEG